MSDELKERVDALEKRIAALEKRPRVIVHSGGDPLSNTVWCPRCRRRIPRHATNHEDMCRPRPPYNSRPIG